MAALTGAIELIHKPGSDNVITAVLSPLISPDQPSLGRGVWVSEVSEQSKPFQQNLHTLPRLSISLFLNYDSLTFN